MYFFGHIEWLVGDAPLYLKFCSVITNRKSTMGFPTSLEMNIVDLHTYTHTYVKKIYKAPKTDTRHLGLDYWKYTVIKCDLSPFLNRCKLSPGALNASGIGKLLQM